MVIQIRTFPVFFTWLAVCRFCLANDDVVSVVEQSARSLRRLDSLEFTASADVKDIDESGVVKDANELRRNVKLHFIAKNDAFRFDFRLEDTARAKVLSEMVLAKDRNHYQFLNKSVDQLSYSVHNQLQNPTMTLNPVVMPYTWLLNPKEDPLSWSAVRDPRLWDRAAKSGIWVKTESADSGKRVTIKFANAIEGLVYQVTFAEELGYFPIRSVAFEKGEEFGEVTASDFAVFVVDEERAVVPRRVEYTQILDGERDGEFYTLDPTSLQVNHDIDDAIFTLNRSEASVVVDIDAQKSRFDAQTKARQREHGVRFLGQPNSSKSTGWRSPLVGINVGAILLIVGVLIFRRFRRRTG